MGIRMAELEVVISRQSNGVVMYPNKSITVAMDTYILAMGSTLILCLLVKLQFIPMSA